MFKKTAFNLSLVASFILIFAGIPEVNVNMSSADTGTKIEVRTIGSVAHADGEDHACGDDVITWKIFKHAFSHCKWWSWAFLIALLVAAFAGVAALVAASKGSFLLLAEKIWRWIQASGVAASAVLAVVNFICYPGSMCENEDDDDEASEILEALLAL